jgi:protein TonB
MAFLPVFAMPSRQDLLNSGEGMIGHEPRKENGPSGQTSKVYPGETSGEDAVLQAIIRKIEAAKRYPRAARRMGIEGAAVVRFKLQPRGQVEAVELLESSGSEILDKASLETVRDAAPLPFKEGWLKVGIVFKIL